MLPTIKEEILANNGCMLMRGGFGDWVKVVTKSIFHLWKEFETVFREGKITREQSLQEIRQRLHNNGF